MTSSQVKAMYVAAASFEAGDRVVTRERIEEFVRDAQDLHGIDAATARALAEWYTQPYTQGGAR